MWKKRYNNYIDHCAKYAKNKLHKRKEKENSQGELASILYEYKKYGRPKPKIRKGLHLIYKVFLKFHIVLVQFHSCTAVGNSAPIIFVSINVYNASNPNDAFCYCWSDGKEVWDNNETGTNLYDWLCLLPLNMTEVLIIFCTCRGQNRIQSIAAMVLYPLQSTQENPPQLLGECHCYMECELVHAAI